MHSTIRAQGRRRAATTVELALVLPVFVMFLFGIFEFGRFVFVYTTATNAVRDGVRYAVVHTGSNDTTTTSDIQTIILTQKMGGAGFAGAAVDVYYADPVGLAQSPTVVQHNPSNSDWKQTPYGDKIAADLTGTYLPVMAQILRLPTAGFAVKVTCFMTCEGN